MHFISAPTKALRGEIRVPGDKSMSHRSVILASLAKGCTLIRGFLESEDCLATLKAMQSLGVVIERKEQHLLVQGLGKDALKKPEKAIDCGNSGTTMRLLAGVLAAQSFDSELTGDKSLLKRPMKRVCEPLRQMGAEIESYEGLAPLKIKGGKVLQGVRYELPEASAQVKSCVLLAGLYARDEVSVLEPLPSRDHTELMLQSFGYTVEKMPYPTVGENASLIKLAAHQEGLATEITIPGDLSSAAFFIVAATLIPDSQVLIRQVGINPTRAGVLHLLLKMGAKIFLLNQRYVNKELVADVQVQHAPLFGITIEPSWVPLTIDEFPILFIAAACAKGQTVLQGAKELRYKESDRIEAMVKGLQQLGIDAQALEDGVVIEGGAFQGGLVDSFGDHRIAMAFAIAGAVASSPIKVLHCENVATSFPSFVEHANELQLNIEEVVDYV